MKCKIAVLTTIQGTGYPNYSAIDMSLGVEARCYDNCGSVGVPGSMRRLYCLLAPVGEGGGRGREGCLVVGERGEIEREGEWN